MGWVSNERAMLISRQIKAGVGRWGHNVETQSQVPSITQKQNKAEWMHLNIFLYLEVLTLYNFNSYLTCSCFLCLSFLQCCIKKHSGNARVTVAAVGRTCFFSHESFNRSLENLKMKLLHLSGQIWPFVSFFAFVEVQNHYFCMHWKNNVIHCNISSAC